MVGFVFVYLPQRPRCSGTVRQRQVFTPSALQRSIRAMPSLGMHITQSIGISRKSCRLARSLSLLKEKKRERATSTELATAGLGCEHLLIIVGRIDYFGKERKPDKRALKECARPLTIPNSNTPDWLCLTLRVYWNTNNNYSCQSSSPSSLSSSLSPSAAAAAAI